MVQIVERSHELQKKIKKNLKKEEKEHDKRKWQKTNKPTMS